MKNFALKFDLNILKLSGQKQGSTF